MSDPTFTDFMQAAYALRKRIVELDAKHRADAEAWRALNTSLTAYVNERQELVDSLRRSVRDVPPGIWTQDDESWPPLKWGLPQ